MANIIVIFFLAYFGSNMECYLTANINLRLQALVNVQLTEKEIAQNACNSLLLPIPFVPINKINVPAATKFDKNTQ